ncbi:MAG: ArgE/DapE family deacylase [Terrimicrobiaceae bacterium]
MTTSLLRELIRIPSVNPEGEPGVAEPGEGELAKYLADWLGKRGADVELREVVPGRPNVIGRFPSALPGSPRLLLAPHTDTVSVAGMTIDPFGGEIQEGRIWGRGASDTKGPMAAMLTAIDRCQSILSGLGWEIWFAGLMGEEAGLLGSRSLAAEEKFDMVIVGEPTELATVCAHKGSGTVRICAEGRSAHASTPEAGTNAIDRALGSLECLRAAFRHCAAGVSHQVLGGPTLSVGTIRGGTKSNVIPDHCLIEVDLRTVPGFEAEAVVAAAESEGVKLDLRTAPPLDTDPGHPLIRKLSDLGAAPSWAPWFCDAAAFAAVGTPAVALGPGSIAQAHTADEWIAVEDLERGADFFEAFLRSLVR